VVLAVDSTLKILVLEANVGVAGRGYWGMALAVGTVHAKFLD
jgi:hypothetical protein